MNKFEIRNEELDQIGRQLLETVRVPSEEIEKIVAAPQLFESVKARIEADQSKLNSKVSFSNWAFFPVWNWQRAAGVFRQLAAPQLGSGAKP